MNMQVIEHNITDGAELVNAALRILDEWHGFMPEIYAHQIATEWAQWEHAGGLEPDTHEAQNLHLAAIVAVCRWYGIRDMAGFLKYMDNYTKRAGRADG